MIHSWGVTQANGPRPSESTTKDTKHTKFTTYGSSSSCLGGSFVGSYSSQRSSPFRINHEGHEAHEVHYIWVVFFVPWWFIRGGVTQANGPHPSESTTKDTKHTKFTTYGSSSSCLGGSFVGELLKRTVLTLPSQPRRTRSTRSSLHMGRLLRALVVHSWRGCGARRFTQNPQSTTRAKKMRLANGAVAGTDVQSPSPK